VKWPIIEQGVFKKSLASLQNKYREGSSGVSACLCQLYYLSHSAKWGRKYSKLAFRKISKKTKNKIQIITKSSKKHFKNNNHFQHMLQKKRKSHIIIQQQNFHKSNHSDTIKPIIKWPFTQIFTKIKRSIQFRRKIHCKSRQRTIQQQKSNSITKFQIIHQSFQFNKKHTLNKKPTTKSGR